MPGQLHISMSKHRSSRITIFVTCLDRHPTWNRYSLACLISRQYYMLSVGSKFILMGLRLIQKSGSDIGLLKYSAPGPNVIPINGSSVYSSISRLLSLRLHPRVTPVIGSSGISEDRLVVYPYTTRSSAMPRISSVNRIGIAKPL
jgi:hypothetical protein